MNARSKRLALYARVSTTDQNAQMQLDELRALAGHRGWTLVGEYVDQGVSGTKTRRPELDRLLKDVHRGRVDAVAVWKLDRLARSVRHLVMLADDLRALGVDLISAQDAIDTTSPSGRFSFHVLGAVAELERELIRERTFAGLAAARRRGVKLGRKRREFDPAVAAELRAGGMSYKAIAAKLGVSTGTIFATLKGRSESSSESPSATPKNSGGS